MGREKGINILSNYPREWFLKILKKNEILVLSIFSFLNSAREKKHFHHTGRKISFEKGGGEIMFQEKMLLGEVNLSLVNDARRNFFTNRVAERWNKLPRKYKNFQVFIWIKYKNS